MTSKKHRSRSVALFIAWRYFFSRKRTNAVNIIAIVSVLGISLVAMAMVCVMSVFNGFEAFTDDQLSDLTPPYIIRHVDGTPFLPDSLEVDGAHVLAGQAIADFEGNAQAVSLVGIDSLYQKIVPIGEYTFEGTFDLGDAEVPSTVMGIGVAANVGAGAGYFSPLRVTVPKRVGRISTVLPMRSFVSRDLYIAGLFRTDQPEDESRIYLPLSTVQELLQYPAGEVSYIARATPYEGFLPQGYEQLTRREQHPEVYRVLVVEKWVSAMLLLFVLLLSLFSVISTLGMLIIEKEQDATTLSVLGARPRLIDSIIVLESWLLSITGTVLGVAAGILLVLLQDRYGFLKLGDGSSDFLLSAYPVVLRWTDVVGVIAVILLIGWLSSQIAYRVFRRPARS